MNNLYTGQQPEDTSRTCTIKEWDADILGMQIFLSSHGILNTKIEGQDC